MIRVPRVRVLAFALLTLATTACQTETHSSGITSVRPDTPDHVLVARARIESKTIGAKDGSAEVARAPVGVLKTYRFEDGTGRRIHRIFDLRDQPVGYVTQDGVAYRYTAHGGTELVANAQELGRNVAAIFGTPLVDMEVVVEGGEL